MTVVASSAVSEAFMPAHERSSGATEKPADPQGDDGAAITSKRGKSTIAPAKRIKDVHHDLKRGEQLSPEEDCALAYEHAKDIAEK
jgi:hypothetical protein